MIRPLPSPASLRLVLGVTALLVVFYETGAAALIGSLDRTRLAVGLAGPLFLLLPLIAALRVTRLPPASTLGLGPVPTGATAAGVFAVVAGVPAVLAVTGRMAKPSPALERFFDELLRADSSAELVVVLIVAALIPAVSEEIVFRGWLQRGLERRLGGLAAIGVTATVFGVIHGTSRAPTAIGFGLMLGWLAHRSGSVGPSVAAHVAVNSLAVAIANADLGRAVGDAGSSIDAVAIPWGAALISAGLSALGFLVFDRVCPPARAGEAAPVPPAPPCP